MEYPFVKNKSPSHLKFSSHKSREFCQERSDQETEDSLLQKFKEILELNSLEKMISSIEEFTEGFSTHHFLGDHPQKAILNDFYSDLGKLVLMSLIDFFEENNHSEDKMGEELTQKLFHHLKEAIRIALENQAYEESSKLD